MKEEGIGHERSPVVITNPKRFADTLAADHGRADYKHQEKNSIQYDGKKDNLEIRFDSSASLKALYDWLEEGKDEYQTMDMSSGEIEAYEQAIEIVHLRLKYEGENCRVERCVKPVENEALLQDENQGAMKLGLCRNHTKFLESIYSEQQEEERSDSE